MTSFAGHATRTGPQAASKSARADRGRRADWRRLRPVAEPLEGRRLMTSGAVDPTFGMGGSVRAPFYLGPDGFMRSVAAAVQVDGKIVVAGFVVRGNASNSSAPADFAIVRLDANGARDATFGGGDGAVVVDLNRGSASNDRPGSLTIQPDGKIVVAGTASTDAVAANGFPLQVDLALVRLVPDGSLDAGFGTGGRAFANLPPHGSTGSPGSSTAESLAIQPDGQIVVAGSVISPSLSSTASTTRQDYLARFDTSGGLDSTFSGDGIREVAGVSVGFGSSRVAVQADGKIIRGGQLLPGNFGPFGTESPGFIVDRFNVDGSDDPTFGAGGRATVAFVLDGGQAGPITGRAVLGDLAIQADGRIVAIGTFEGSDRLGSSSTSAFAAARLNLDGSLDPTFDGDGLVTVAFDRLSTYAPNATAVAIQPDGKLLLGGSIYLGSAGSPGSSLRSPILAVVRLNPDGSPDLTFGAGGTSIVDSLPGLGRASEIATQADGQIVVYGNTATLLLPFLARLNGSGPPAVPGNPTPTPPAVAPTVVSASPLRRRIRTFAVVVQFNTEVDPASANAAGNYSLFAVGRPRRRGRLAPLRPLAIDGAVYDPATLSVTLSLSRPVLRNVRLRLGIAGASFFGSTGVRLAGSGGIGTDLVVPVA